MIKVMMIGLACILLTLGLLSWLTPFPGGTPAIAIGLSILICTSETAARTVLNSRARFARLNSVMMWFENTVPARLGDVLRRTRPSMD